MNRVDILKRVNQVVYEGLYRYEDIEQDLDDSIDKINESLHTKFPYFSEVLTDDNKEYTYDLNGSEVPIFPEKYIRSVCINYVVRELMRREDEFGMLYQTAEQRYLAGIDTMFRDHYNRVAPEFQDDEGGYLEFDDATPKYKPITPWGFEE